MIVSPHIYDVAEWERRERAWPTVARLDAALRLALDPDAWADLVRGVPVDPRRLDRGELARSRYVVFASPGDVLEVAA